MSSNSYKDYGEGTAHKEEDLDKGLIPWSIDFDADFLLDVEVGLQHLLGILLGDPFSRSHPDVESATTSVQSVTLGHVWQNYFKEYRTYSNSLEEIKDKYCPERPFLAFTAKPRMGWHELSIKAMEELVRGVIDAGFDMFELDTRYLWPRGDDHDQNLIRLINAASEAADARGRRGVFCPNLTMPWATAERVADLIFQRCDQAEIAFKIDGGLDGLSTIQSIRRKYKDEKPIITSYPLLSYSPLSKRLGDSTFKKWLALSGADIIYPGGAPRLRLGGEIDRETLRQAQLNYNRITSKGWPLPSIAGGVHPGEFHALIELLGYNHALFIGGGVALHKDGILAGARWASNALDMASELGREKDVKVWDRSEKRFKDNRGLFDENVVGTSNFEYIPPKELLEESDVERFVDRTAVQTTDNNIEPKEGL